MVHATRGRRSGAWEIQELVGVDLDVLSLTVRHAGAYQPKVLHLNVQPTPAARQLLQAIADSIKVGPNGDGDSAWESVVTLDRSFSWSQILLAELKAAGLDDFSSQAINVPVLRRLYQPLTSSSKRNACWLLARVIRTTHPNGTALSHALRNTRFQVDYGVAFTYDEAISAAIEQVARGVYTAGYVAQREVFARLGYDVSGREWLRIPPEELIEWAERTQPEASHRDTIQPRLAPSFEQQVAWALTHPSYFGYVKNARKGQVLGTMGKLGVALYPDNVLLTAAIILHCLGENSGYNQSVLLEKNVLSLVHLGPDHALERSVKSRNKTQDTRATRVSSIYTPGGVIETLTGLTRFSRHHRRNLTNPDGTPSTIVDRLYVEHCSDPAAACVLSDQRRASAWRSSVEWDKHWDASAGPRDQVPLRLSALRLAAQARAMGEGLRADVHGHTEHTKMHYTAHVLPDYVFNRHAVEAQNGFHDDAAARFTVVAGATEGPAAELAAIDQADIMDVEIGLCTSGGNDPGDHKKRCSLGMVACFTCPNGYRTVDHIPGLLAAVELGDIVERNDPGEWEGGQASHLRFYSQACLDQFPPMVVANVKRRVDLAPHVLTVAGLYMEMRHG